MVLGNEQTGNPGFGGCYAHPRSFDAGRLLGGVERLTHRMETECPICKTYVGTYQWLKTIVKVRKDSNKIGSLPVYSRCPYCGCVSWQHYDKSTIETAKLYSDYIDKMILSQDNGANSLVQISIRAHKYED